MDSIGNRIKQIRKESDLSQKNFGNIVSISNGHLSAIERNKVIPSDRIIRLICSEFQVNEEWLRNGTGEKSFAVMAVKDTWDNEIRGLKKLDNFSRLFYEYSKKYLRLCAILAPGGILAGGTIPLEHEPDLICMVNYLQYRFGRAKDEKEKMLIAVKFESVFPDYFDVVLRLNSEYEKTRREMIDTLDKIPSYDELYKSVDDVLQSGKKAEEVLKLLKTIE